VPSPTYEKFIASMVMDYMKWHDGDGYDLDALKELDVEERAAAVAVLAEHLRYEPDWRDIEALAAVDAREPLRYGLDHGSTEIRARAARALTSLGEDVGLEDKIVAALHHAGPFAGLSNALDLAEEHPTERVKAALRDVALNGSTAEARVNAAGLALYLGGKAESAFDWNHRPFFLRFGEEDPAKRRAAYEELCQRLGVP
jgi:HEAT repeat protein